MVVKDGKRVAAIGTFLKICGIRVIPEMAGVIARRHAELNWQRRKLSVWIMDDGKHSDEHGDHHGNSGGLSRLSLTFPRTLCFIISPLIRHLARD